MLRSLSLAIAVVLRVVQAQGVVENLGHDLQCGLDVPVLVFGVDRLADDMRRSGSAILPVGVWDAAGTVL